MKIKEVVVQLNELQNNATIYLISGDFKKKVMDIDIPDLDKNDPLIIQSKLGVVVFNALGLHENLKDSELQEDLDRADKLILEMAEKGDPKAQKAVASTCMQNSLRLRDISLLEDAEMWLKRSSDSGYAKAISFLKETWPNLKIDYRNKILNNESE